MLKTILSIAGKPGLYKLISQGKNMLIVETVDAAKKRVPAYAHDKVISLADIAMYTDAEEVPLSEVLEAVKKKENGAVASINYKKASADELHAYFAEILPNYDRDRVHNGDIKKLISWYNILVNNGITEFVEAPAESADKGEEAAVKYVKKGEGKNPAKQFPICLTGFLFIGIIGKRSRISYFFQWNMIIDRAL